VRGNGKPRVLDAGTPVLFQPVNIETRFMDIGAGHSELWVRIYPDQIAINSHENELTIQEAIDGKAYWDAIWRAGKPPALIDSAKAPWRGLASRYGAPRAAWVALQMTPTNIAQQPLAPTPEGANPSPLPEYPQPPTRSSSWEKPAIAEALPDAWTVVMVSGSEVNRFHGSPITPGLSIGMTPGAGAFPPGSPVDAGMTWLVDFDTALNAGMALKIPLTSAQRQIGFDRIFVYGLRTQDSSGRDTFANLLDAHHYTDGFSLLPQGAPTNNTPDAVSAYSRKDPDYETSFAVERQEPLTHDTTADGNAFATLIGIDLAHMDHAGHADSTGARNGHDMLTALWPATLGYFLSQMMADVFTADEIEAARQYVLAHAVPRGPVPAFRIGRTPYGVMPVTSLRRYQVNEEVTGGSVEPGLVDFIQRLWQTWLTSSDSAPHMQKSGDPDAELVSLLGMDASSMTFRGREVLGDYFLWNYMNFLTLPFPFMNQWWSDVLSGGRQLLDSFQYNRWDPRMIHVAMAENSFPVELPTVQAGPLSETDALKDDADLGNGTKGNYIQWLRQASVSDIQAENYPGPKPTSLLYKVLRQSVILDYAGLATNEEIKAGRLQTSQVREAELIGIAPSPSSQQASASIWEVLARPAAPNPKLTWADYLVNLDPPPESDFSRLTELRASLDRLAALSTAELDRLLTETLDACSHRLDVWATTVATAILQRTRDRGNSKVHVGGYGWVEEVRPATPRTKVQGTELDQVRALDERRARTYKTATALPPPVEPLQDNGGFIYAPSLAHASVAAVLRTGYMTHKGTNEEGLLSIDLSSERVRRALWLLDGVRQGQSLNALLGYLFESGVHNLQLDKYIQPFRDRFPIVANKLTPSSEPSESVAASNVVDGLALRTAWDNGQLAVGQDWGSGLPASGSDQDAIVGVLKTIDDYTDALGDMSISEAVFQVIRGNFGRAGTLMDAVSKGTHAPDPEVINTPRGGLDLTHRVAVLFAGDPTLNPTWNGVTTRPRAAAEPWLNSWLSELLPDPKTVICQVQYRDQNADKSETVHLLDLDLGPLDCLAMANAAEVPQQSELEYRILYAAQVPTTASEVKIDFHPAGVPVGSVYFPDLLFLAKSLRLLVGAARALTPQDLTIPEQKAADAGGVVDLGDLRARAKSLVQRLENNLTTLQTAITGLPGAPDPVRSALMDCSFYGVSGSVPYLSSGSDPRLAEQADAVVKTLQERYDKASAVVLNTASLSDVLGIFATILGQELVVLPTFTPPDAVSIQSAFAQSSALVAADSEAPSRWLAQLSHVRPAISRLDTALNLAQVLGAAGVAPPTLLLGQLPLAANDKWLGLGIDPAKPPDKGRTAFACIVQGDPVTQNTYAGLLLDEWPERIPSTKETAAVAFHYEEPKARAPQVLLLGVCPDARAAWDDDLVTGILEETLELAKIRTVDLHSLERVGQILPALYFSLNLHGATLSTNFITAKEVLGGINNIR